MLGPMRITVVIPFRNAEATIERCVERLRSSSRPPDEIVLVDDASEDQGFERLSQIDGLIHIRNLDPRGAAYARNVGAAAGSGDVLLFVDADVLAQPDAIELIERRLEQDPTLGGVFGAYTAHTEPRNFASVYKNLVHHYTHRQSAGPIDTFWAGCGALRREAFQAVGGFDQSFAAASVEDIDLGYRLSAAGIKVEIDPRIQVTHVKRYTLAGLIISDLKFRAVPWTALMVRRRRFTPVLNLKPHNLIAAGLAAAALPVLAALLLLGLWTWAVALLGATLIGWAALNRGLLGFVLRTRGLPFAARFALMHLLSHVYSALGLAVGLLMAALSRPQNSRPA
ncbi:MAG: glycosyltransferase [Candidatus Alcyoniella australis]|nr:glycosyltransferase [Candidatus Alcyoniella australis]